jgi:hypothetical protein
MAFSNHHIRKNMTPHSLSTLIDLHSVLPFQRVLVLTLGLLLSASASAQKPGKQITPTRLCSNSDALELLREQVIVSKGIDN